MWLCYKKKIEIYLWFTLTENTTQGVVWGAEGIAINQGPSKTDNKPPEEKSVLRTVSPETQEPALTAPTLWVYDLQSHSIKISRRSEECYPRAAPSNSYGCRLALCRTSLQIPNKLCRFWEWSLNQLGQDSGPSSCLLDSLLGNWFVSPAIETCPSSGLLDHKLCQN